MTITDTEAITVAGFAPAIPTVITPVSMVTPQFDNPAHLGDEKGPDYQPVPSDAAERASGPLDIRHRLASDAPNVPPHVLARRGLADGVIDGGFSHSR